MSTGFSAADFDIIPTGDMLPFPETDPFGVERYAAKLSLPSRSQWNTLISYLSQVTIIPAAGGGALVVVERGVGKRTLTFPAQGGTDEERQAILVAARASTRVLTSGHWEVDAEWVLVSS